MINLYSHKLLINVMTEQFVQ